MHELEHDDENRVSDGGVRGKLTWSLTLTNGVSFADVYTVPEFCAVAAPVADSEDHS